jgi:hypothetical protein
VGRIAVSEAARKHAAIALVAASVIVLQITLTRLLSVLLWYHWAFFSISMAMLGLGAPGVWLALKPPKNAQRLLELVLLCASLLTPVGIALIIKGSTFFGDNAIIFVLVCLLPGVLSLGTAVCLLLMDSRGTTIGRRYAYDLLGACVGALLVVPLMSIIATPHLAAATGLLPLVAILALKPRLEWTSVALAMALLAVIIHGRAFEVKHTKTYEEVAVMKPLYERWTPTARIAVFDKFMPTGQVGFVWGGGESSDKERTFPRQYWLEQDGSAGTPITNFTGDFSKLDYLLDDVTSVAYQVRNPKRVAIVGAGGGRDILTAKLAGAEDIDAIELNAGIVATVREVFGKFSGGVYDLDGVHAIVGEGRSVLTRSEGGYDVIQISMIDSWAATAAGAYSLSENNLYTVGAYRLYFSKLSKDGIVATSRWLPNTGFGFELLRLLTLVGAALNEEGIDDATQHILLVMSGPVGTVLMSRSPFDDDTLAMTQKIVDERGFRMHILGGNNDFLTDLVRDRLTSLPALPVSLAPPTDDKPFFFQPFSPFSSVDTAVELKLGFNGAAVTTLRKLMFTMCVLTFVLFFAPFVLARWMKRQPGFWRGSGFFACIGLSFMFVEIAWLQRFVLYLGHPSLATTVALGCMLLGAGLGSMASERLGVEKWQRFGWVTAVVIAGLSALLSPAFGATLGWTFPMRLALSVVLITPPAFAMGFFFPLGMVRFGDDSKAWFWAINGAAGVLASVLSLALSMELGFSTVAFMGAGLYVVAWILALGEPCESGSAA